MPLLCGSCSSLPWQKTAAIPQLQFIIVVDTPFVAQNAVLHGPCDHGESPVACGQGGRCPYYAGRAGHWRSLRSAEAEPHGPDFSADHRVSTVTILSWWSLSLLAGCADSSLLGYDCAFALRGSGARVSVGYADTGKDCVLALLAGAGVHCRPRLRRCGQGLCSLCLAGFAGDDTARAVSVRSLRRLLEEFPLFSTCTWTSIPRSILVPARFAQRNLDNIPMSSFMTSDGGFCRILRHFSRSVRMDVSAHFSALDDEEFFVVEGSGWRGRQELAPRCSATQLVAQYARARTDSPCR